jgi:small conductance mechanosensitive channel
MMGDNIVNYTAEEMRRIDLVAGVSYGDDLDKVRKVLEDILSKDERILKDPAPTIGVLELADSSVNFAVRPWVKTPDYWNVFFATQESIKKRFDAEGISIPFPQQDVHLHKGE